MSPCRVSSQLPVFVQIQHKWRRMYAGECQGPGLRTDFEMVHLRKVPSQYNHLSGLLDVFKSKIVRSFSTFKGSKKMAVSVKMNDNVSPLPSFRLVLYLLFRQSTLQSDSRTFFRTGSSIHGHSSLRVGR